MDKIQKKIQEIEYQILENKVTEEKNLLLTEMKKIGIEKLPYSYSALKTFIDPETMDFHYNKHYKGYVDKLNAALAKKKYGDVDLEKIIKNISKYDKTIRNNAGGAFNHALFWNMLTPKPKRLTGELYKKISKEFGTFTNFKKKFEAVAKDRFGSGWVWLVLTKNNKLKVMSTPNQDNPLMNVIEGGGFPLLGLDLWEHAYYLKYRNKRDEYITNFWKVINWDFISKLFEMKSETKLLESKFEKSLMTEQKDVAYIEACDRKEQDFFQKLISSDIGKIYGKRIYKTLDKVPWLEFRPKDETINRMQGFYKDGERHPISYLAGNYRAFCMLAKSINNLLIKMGREPLNIAFNENKDELTKSVTRMMNILEKYHDKIFNEESSIYKALMTNLQQSKLKGEQVENLTELRFKNKFGDIDFKVSSQFGKQSDNEGFDADVTIDGKNLSMQVKPFDTNFVEEGKMVVLTTGKIHKYTQDLMVFTNKQVTLVFKNQNTILGINAYKFPVEDLIYELT